MSDDKSNNGKYPPNAAGYPQGPYPYQPAGYNQAPPPGYGYPPPRYGGYGGQQAPQGYPPYPQAPQPGGYGGAPQYAPYNPEAGLEHLQLHPDLENGGGGVGGSEIPPDKLLSDDLDVAVRHGFVRKVYGILLLQLLLTFGIDSVFAFNAPAASWLIHNRWLAFVGMGVSMLLICCMSCFPDDLARKWPTNIIMLTGIALGMSMMVGVAVAVVSPVIFLCALATTAAVVLGLTLFAFQTKWDFTGCGPYVLVASLVMVIFGIINIFIHNRILHLVYSSLGALVFSFFLVYDTQQIVGGKHRQYQYSIDDYVFACLTLYLDIINLFMMILQIFSAANEDN